VSSFPSVASSVESDRPNEGVRRPCQSSLATSYTDAILKTHGPFPCYRSLTGPTSGRRWLVCGEHDQGECARTKNDHLRKYGLRRTSHPNPPRPWYFQVASITVQYRFATWVFCCRRYVA
jgi:hypothetical protein